MSITKTQSVDQIMVAEDGTVFVRMSIKIIEDGVLLSETYARTSYLPGADVSAAEPRVQAVCAATWTDEVVSSFKSAMVRSA